MGDPSGENRWSGAYLRKRYVPLAVANQAEMGVLAKIIHRQRWIGARWCDKRNQRTFGSKGTWEKGFGWFSSHDRTSYALDQILVDLGFGGLRVINIEVDLSCLLERLSGRIIHRRNRWNYHKVFNPPADYKERLIPTWRWQARNSETPLGYWILLKVSDSCHYRGKGLVHDEEIKTSATSSKRYQVLEFEIEAF